MEIDLVASYGVSSVLYSVNDFGPTAVSMAISSGYGDLFLFVLLISALFYIVEVFD